MARVDMTPRGDEDLFLLWGTKKGGEIGSAAA